MQASKFSDAQKAFILKQGNDGMPVAKIRRACGVFMCDTSTYHYKSRRPGQAELELRMTQSRSAGLRQRRDARLLQARKAGRQCIHRSVQWTVQSRMSQRVLVHEP